MQCNLIYSPGVPEKMLFKKAIWATMGKTMEPKSLPGSQLLHSVLEARHSPCRVLNFAFEFVDIPSNISVHLARHVHATPFVQSLRNDRQEIMNGDEAPRNTPVYMIFYLNVEELMVIANKRLCGKASTKTREAVRMMCDEAIKVMPELKDLLVPMCTFHGGVCHEVQPCGRPCRRMEGIDKDHLDG